MHYCVYFILFHFRNISVHAILSLFTLSLPINDERLSQLIRELCNKQIQLV